MNKIILVLDMLLSLLALGERLAKLLVELQAEILLSGLAPQEGEKELIEARAKARALNVQLVNLAQKVNANPLDT